MSDCVFCAIVSGNEPATVLADGISSLAIVPLNPVTDGHFLVIPKKHVADAYEDDRTSATTMADASLWARLFSDRDDRYKSVNIITSVGRPATQSVFHLHLHVVPRAENDGLALPWVQWEEGVEGMKLYEKLLRKKKKEPTQAVVDERGYPVIPNKLREFREQEWVRDEDQNHAPAWRMDRPAWRWRVAVARWAKENGLTDEQAKIMSYQRDPFDERPIYGVFQDRQIDSLEAAIIGSRPFVRVGFEQEWRQEDEVKDLGRYV